jgi:hypothetical protein
MAQWEAEHNKFQLNNKVEELYNMLKQQQESLNYFNNAALEEANSLQKIALAQFEESEIDIVEFVQSLNSSKQIKLNYIQTIYDYNISVLEIELYTQKL